MLDALLDFIRHLDNTSIKRNVNNTKDFMETLKKRSERDKTLTKLGFFLKSVLPKNLVECLDWVAFYFRYPSDCFFNEKGLDGARDWIAIKYKDQSKIDPMYQKIFSKSFKQISENYYIPSILQEKIKDTAFKSISKNIWIMLNSPVKEKNFSCFAQNSFIEGDFLELEKKVSFFSLINSEVIITYCAFVKNALDGKITLSNNNPNRECGIDCRKEDLKLHEILYERSQDVSDKYNMFCTSFLNNYAFLPQESYIRIPLFWDSSGEYVTEAYLSVRESTDLIISKLNEIYTILYKTMGLINNKFSYFVGKKLGEEYDEINLLEKQLKDKEKGDFIGSSDLGLEFKNLSNSIARIGENIIIVGEQGSGKKFTARKIHRESNRGKKPVVILNRVTFRSVLLKINSGTIIIDEPSKLTEEDQNSLLIFIEDESFKQNKNLIVILITKGDLIKRMRDSSTLHQIVSSLNGFTIKCIPLRDRSKDIEDFACFNVEYYCSFYGKKSISISKEALTMLEKYKWPGNIQELRTVIASAILSCKKSKIRPSDLPSLLQENITSSYFICPLTKIEINENIATETYSFFKNIEKRRKSQVRPMFLCPVTEHSRVKAIELGINTSHSFGWAFFLFWYAVYWKPNMDKNKLLFNTQKIFNVKTYNAIWRKVRDYIKSKQLHNNENDLSAKKIHKLSALRFKEWFENSKVNAK